MIFANHIERRNSRLTAMVVAPVFPVNGKYPRGFEDRAIS